MANPAGQGKAKKCTMCGKTLGSSAMAKSGKQFCCSYCCDRYFIRNKPKVCEFC